MSLHIRFPQKVPCFCPPWLLQFEDMYYTQPVIILKMLYLKWNLEQRDRFAKNTERKFLWVHVEIKLIKDEKNNLKHVRQMAIVRQESANEKPKQLQNKTPDQPGLPKIFSPVLWARSVAVTFNRRFTATLPVTFHPPLWCFVIARSKRPWQPRPTNSKFTPRVAIQIYLILSSCLRCNTRSLSRAFSPERSRMGTIGSRTELPKDLFTPTIKSSFKKFPELLSMTPQKMTFYPPK